MLKSQQEWRLMIMEKLKNTACILDRVFKIIFCLLAVFCTVLIVFSAIVLFRGEAIVQSEAFRLSLKNSGILVNIDTISLTNITMVLFSIVISHLITIAFGIYATVTIRKMIAPMKQGRPFNASVSTCFTHLAWLALIFGLLKNSAKLLALYLIPDAIKDFTLITGIAYNVGDVLDGTLIIAAGLMFLFSFVFKYGEQLQQLSDETL